MDAEYRPGDLVALDPEAVRRYDLEPWKAQYGPWPLAVAEPPADHTPDPSDVLLKTSVGVVAFKRAYVTPAGAAPAKPE